MLETLFGIKITHLGAGFAGGTVRYILLGGSWMAGVTSVISGSLTAAYLTTPAYFFSIKYFPVAAEPSTEHAVGFLVGLCGLLFCEGVMNYVKKRRDKIVEAEGPAVGPGASIPPVKKAGE